jgi:hypothetical protein
MALKKGQFLKNVCPSVYSNSRSLALLQKIARATTALCLLTESKGTFV